MKVKDIMSTKVITVSPETTFHQIGKLIFGKDPHHKFSSVPVVDNKGILIGIITEKDLLRRLFPSQREIIENYWEASDYDKMEDRVCQVEGLIAKNIMTKNPVVTKAEAPLMKAGSQMLLKSVRRLPVVDKDHKLVGVISQGDIFRALIVKVKCE